MSDDPLEHLESSYDPGSMSSSSLGITKAVWYRRPWVLITLAVAAVVILSVISDLPSHITKAQDASEQNSVIVEVNTDLKECTVALNQAFSFYAQDVQGTLTATDRSFVPSYLSQDQVGCSFAGPAVTDLTNNIEVTTTDAGNYVAKMISVVVNWMTDNADAAILDIEHLYANPSDAKALGNLNEQETRLAKNRALALADVARADTFVDVNLTTPAIPVMPVLPGTT